MQCPSCGCSLSLIQHIPNNKGISANLLTNSLEIGQINIKVERRICEVAEILIIKFGKICSINHIKVKLYGCGERPKGEDGKKVIIVQLSILRKIIKPHGYLIKNIKNKGWMIINIADEEEKRRKIEAIKLSPSINSNSIYTRGLT